MLICRVIGGRPTRPDTSDYSARIVMDDAYRIVAGNGSARN
jgi:hypothetical protein